MSAEPKTERDPRTGKVQCICECHRIWNITGMSFCSRCDCWAAGATVIKRAEKEGEAT